MIRKDIALDSDRPHFYSQYWIEVAMGKHEEASSSVAEADVEPEEAMIEPEEIPEVVVPRPARPVRAKVEIKKTEQPRSAVTSLQDLAQMMKTSAEMDADTVPDIDSAVSAPDQLEDVIVTDFDPDTVVAETDEPAEDAEPEFADEEFEDDDEWGNEEGQPRRGSKPVKRQRREQRRDF